MTEIRPWSDEFVEEVRRRQEWLWNRNPDWSDRPPTKAALERAQRIALYGTKEPKR